MPKPETRIARFQRKEIRCTLHNNEWWFVIKDVMAAATDTVDPKRYLKEMRQQDATLARDWRQLAIPLLIGTPGGPQRSTVRTPTGWCGCSNPSPARRPRRSAVG